MRTSALLLGALLCFAARESAAQNLVANGCFETYALCPTTDGQLYQATPWFSPNGATSDYLNACTTLTPDVPTNFWGTQAAYEGQAYASIICYGQLPSAYREYAAGELASPLLAGHSYSVSLRVSLADRSNWAIAELGVHFQAGPHAGPPNAVLPVTPQFENPSANLLTDKTNWVQLSGTYLASGGEDHLAIGNFRDNASTTAAPAPGGIADWCIYYIDCVEVVDLGPTNPCTPHLIGWSDLPFATTGFLDVQDIASCERAETRCLTASPVSAVTPYSGGTAYNARYRTAWVSDGALLAEFYVAATPSFCRRRCGEVRATISDPSAVVSGLAFGDARQQLFQLATRPGAMEITIYDASGRCLDAPRQCRRELPFGSVAGGLAYDEVRDLLFVAVSVPSPLGGFATELWVLPASAPCEPLCRTPIFRCSRELVTGLAYDACARELYVTDGRETQTYEVLDARRCDLREGACCAKQLAPSYRGLDVIPCSTQRTTGTSCTTASCATCPTMHIASSGDPVLGANFEVRLVAAPVGALAYLLLQPGPCTPPLPLPSPWCGALLVDIGSSLVLPVGATSGTPPCGGQIQVEVPISADPLLCAQTFCAQWLFFCPGSPTGFGLSDALEFTVAGG
jgi:hypothetical protein